MKNTVTRISSLMLALLLLVSAFPLTALAASWPSLSGSGYCEMVVPFQQVNVYQDANCTVRGTCQPQRSYNAYLSKNDVVRIYGVTDKRIILDYPVSSGGRRTGYVLTSQLFGRTSPSEVITSKAKVTTYTNTNTANKSGYIAVNDAVYKLGTTSSGYALVIYSAKNSSGRAYKAAFITKADYEKLKANPASSCGSQAMSTALYQSSGGYLSCCFDGYSKTSGRHEGIDFVKGYGCAVYSLTDGVITRITEGANGSNGLSTIAIYNSVANKTVIYLHSDPLDSLHVGQAITRGQQIATEAWRGVSSSSGTHTHVEVRNGEKTSASKSVGDPTLDNPEPSSFWNSQGYQVK